MNFNRVILHGRITTDLTVNQTQNGTPYCRFSVAVDRPYKKDREEKATDYFECTAWRGTAEFLGKYFSKGSEILLEGKLTNNNYQDSNGVKHYACVVQVDLVEFCGKKADKNFNETPDENKGGDDMQTDVEAVNFTELPFDEDLPF